MRVSGSLPFRSDSPLLFWDARWRLVSLLLLVFAISSVSNLLLLPGILGFVLAVVFWSGAGIREVVRRLRFPSLVIVAIILFLPFAAEGREIFSVASLSVTEEGMTAALLVGIRFYSILLLAIVFLGSAPLLVHLQAARDLGVPALLADLALLVVRYIEVVSVDLHAMRVAMRLRGDTGRSWQNVRNQTWLLASLLLRSHERSSRVYRAMRLRGYGQRRQGEPVERPKRRFRREDWAMTSVFLGCGIFLLLAQWIWV